MDLLKMFRKNKDAMGSGEVISDDEKLIQSVKDFRSKAHKERNLIEHQRLMKMRAAQIKIDYAEDFINKTRIDSSFLVMVNEMRYWDSWSKKDGFEVSFPASNLNTKSERTNGKENFEIGFVYKGISYCFKYQSERDEFWDSYISFEVDGEEVICLKVSLNEDRGIDHWKYEGVYFLKTGSWVQHVAEIEEAIKLTNDIKRKKWHTESLLEQAINLPEVP